MVQSAAMRSNVATILLFTALAACDGGAKPGDLDVDADVGAPAAFIPQPTGVCPPLMNGDVTFAPAGVPPRKVRLAFTEGGAAGPLVIYWHATGSAVEEADYALGATKAAMIASGTLIAAPYSDDAAGQFEWWIVNQSTRQDDFLVADEVVACLAQAGRIDTRRIHVMGMSAGALQTTAMSLFRSSYVASVVTFSGGIPAQFTPPPLDPENLFAALIFHGGASDNAFSTDFRMASETYRSMLTAAGHFTAVCDHGNGHTIPRDAAPAAAQFFADHPFGQTPSPYAAAGLPASFPAYCAR